MLKLIESGGVEAIVVAPVPWFPFEGKQFGEYAINARVPRDETRRGVRVLHPRYPVIPKVGMAIAPFLMARTLLPFIRRLHAEIGFDLIDSHYLYPDGVAATTIARALGLPNTITARGSDVTLIPDFASPRRQIIRSARHCSGVVSVCHSLKRDMVAMGVEAEKISVLRNGVDLTFFRPQVRERCPAGDSSYRLLCVGSLIDVKRHHVAIDALTSLPDCSLRIVGSGHLLPDLKNRAERLGVAHRVEFLGQQPQDRLVELYNEADCSLLMSSREGMANVILESLACGTPVVATNVGAASEVLTEPVAGALL
ncbi:MAG: glycosyltransferase, partial [Pseudomonadota bacterium]